MTYQLFAGLFTEGPTDVRFLENIIQKTLEKVAFDCHGQIEIILTPIEIDKSTLNFKEQVLAASKKGMDDFGMMMFCIHKDADSISDEDAFQNNILPAQKALQEASKKEYCQNLVPIVPIQETEAWMLGDKELLKKQIGTTKSDAELGINRSPENIASPKEVISNAINIARQDLSKRRRSHLNISDLYLSIGQAMELEKLAHFSSYQKFEANVRTAFRHLNLLP